MCGLTTLTFSGSNEDLSVIRTRENTNRMCAVSYVAAAIFATIALVFNEYLKENPAMASVLTVAAINISLIVGIIFGFKKQDQEDTKISNAKR